MSEINKTFENDNKKDIFENIKNNEWVNELEFWSLLSKIEWTIEDKEFDYDNQILEICLKEELKNNEVNKWLRDVFNKYLNINVV